jgi:L-2-hydroxycarboxylate dehydrogenase (NAD+)
MANIRVEYKTLLNFIVDVFLKLDLKAEDARIAAVVLTDADVRAIPSHGVGRILRYVNGVKSGMMLPSAEPTTVRETPGSLLIDANGGMGHPVSYRTMKRVIEKAEANGSAFATIRNSNHYGIAGHYAMMALDHDMLGISLTNTPALSVPTFGRDVMFVTNPIAFAAPADREKAFVLDMATTVTPRGKIEVHDRKKQPIPLGWAVDKAGRPTTDPHALLDDMFHRRGGGILPLGGAGEEFGGHKGYGLAVMVDVLCAVLAGGPFGPELSDTDTTRRVSHFFGAIKISGFRDPKEFRADMDRMLTNLRN